MFDPTAMNRVLIGDAKKFEALLRALGIVDRRVCDLTDNPVR
jgi:hypothetical protein